MSSPRMTIRCPNCRKDGSARAELVNRRVTCKHCSHVFRALPIEEGDATVSLPTPPASIAPPTAPAADASRERIEALELEIRRLREDRTAEHAAGEVESLRERLDRALEAGKKAEAREQTLLKEVEGLRDRLDQGHPEAVDEGRDGLRGEELRFLREQLDKSRAEAEAEARKRREIASVLAARTAEFADALTAKSTEAAQAIASKEAEHSQAIASKEAEAARALDARSAEHAEALGSKEAEHDRAIREAREQVDRVRSEAQAVEARRLGADAARTEAENRHADEDRALRDELDQARKALDGLRADSERAIADQARVVDELKGQLAQLESRLRDAEAARAQGDQLAQERDRLAGELDAIRPRLAEVDRLAAEHKDAADALRLELGRFEAARSGEVADLRGQLDRALAAHHDAETIRHERDEARIQRDRFAEELDALRARVEEAERLAADWGYASTELDVPHAVPDDEVEAEAEAVSEIPAFDPGSSTLHDGGAEHLGAEAEMLRDELKAATDRLARKDAELADLARERDRALAAAKEAERVEAIHLAERVRAEADAQEAGRAEALRVAEQGRVEVEALRRELERARAASESASRSNAELTERIRALETAPAPVAVVASAPAPAPSIPAVDPAVIELERKRSVDEAVKGAWADFERRLAETQAKLKAANARADLMEIEAREAREQFAARERGLDLGDGSSFEEAASMTSIRILTDRGNARLTPADAEARLGLARQVAVERKDKSLIDRIGKMAEKVRDDLEARNYTLAETLVRGAEIETGLDPGGFSINGLRIFRPSPTIVGSLTALAPAFDRVMRQGDIGSIRSTIEEMRTILGDQAGLPEIRRLGRTPAVKRPIARADALRLFLAALEAENWLMRPIATKKPLPDTSLTTYACLIEACAEARGPAQEHSPDRLPLIDGVIQAACAMLGRRQLADGHFSFLDPRGKASKLASVVDAMVAQRPDSVKDGWVVAVDPIGIVQAETAACALAMASAGKATARADWTQAAQKAADWAAGQPCLPNFVANAASAGLLARAYLDAKQDRHLDGLVKKLTIGLLPGQAENGRWIDSSSSTTANHLAILRALHDAWEAMPADRGDLRDDLKSSMDLAMSSLLAECKALGVPSNGGALRALIRHRDLFQAQLDARVVPAILDSATVIQELCHDGPKPKLGVAPDQLAALMKA